MFSRTMEKGKTNQVTVGDGEKEVWDSYGSTDEALCDFVKTGISNPDTHR